MRFSSLRIRIAAICIGIVLLAMIAVVAANIITAKSRMSTSLFAQLEQLAQSRSASIAEWVAAKKSAVASIKPSVALENPKPFAKTAELAGSFTQAYIGYPDKHAVFSQDRARAAEYDPTQRPWYQQAVAVGGPVVTSPYISSSTGKLLVTFAEPVNADGKLLGVVAADVLLDTVVRNVVSIRPTENSYAFLVDGAGKVIAHPDERNRAKTLDKLNPAINAGSLLESGQKISPLKINLDDRDRMLFSEPVAGTDWFLIIVLDQADAMLPITAILKTSLITSLLLTVLAAVALGGLISHSLRRLPAVQKALEEIADGDGDLTRRLTFGGHDELARIAVAFNRFVDKIEQVMAEIRDASRTIHASSRDIAVGNLDLSSRTEAQASSLEETAAAMEELTSSVKNNADNAVQANRLSKSASDIAGRGGIMVEQVVQAMEAIDGSSQKIVDIISVIDAIAFQTNILALNAAVEAARAGEQGRGFAVVASEVRSLAQRSATAAKEIKGLIADSVEQVRRGRDSVSSAGATISSVVESVRKVSDVVAEITSSSLEQSQGINQTNEAMSQMDQATQRNAALVEEAAANAQALEDQATRLADIVALFRLGEVSVSPEQQSAPALRTRMQTLTNT